MGEVSYAPLIRDMTWSYSRASAFEDCPYRWYLKYIRFPRKKWDDTFFATYGSFMHKLIDLHYKEGLAPEQMLERYLHGFRNEVTYKAPSQKVFGNYFAAGIQYLSHFEPIPFAPMETEMEVEFDIDGIPLVGYIDFLGRGDDGISIVDNKSRALKARSRRKTPTKADKELDSYLQQLYLYSVAVKQRYGEYPKWLCFNCFRTQTFIKEPFDEKAYAESRQWLKDKVFEITHETDFSPNIEWFKCQYLCECKNYCEYFDLSER